jgi:hypothetical protein
MKYLVCAAVLLVAGSASAQTIPPPVGGLVPGTVPGSVTNFVTPIQNAGRTAAFSVGAVSQDTAQIPDLKAGALGVNSSAQHFLMGVIPPN